MQKLRAEKGITLIALVITIIVMLILVGVSVTVALNGGLFSTAKEASEGTASKRNEELELSSGKVEINGEWYNSIDEYVKGGSSNEPTQPENPTGYTAYTIGQEVTIGTENFYVLKDSDETQEKLTLLAKYCVNPTTLVQSSSANGIYFSSTSYWSTETTYPLDLNEYETCPEGSAIDIAKQYAEKITGSRDKGRLMTYEEADSLNTTDEYKKILYGHYSDSYTETYLEYWLGSAKDNRNVYFVYGFNQESIQNAPYDDESWDVRPVIEISKSAIQ